MRTGRLARRLPEWPVCLVLGGMAIGLLVVASDHFRRGTVIFALSTVLGAGLRAVLPEQAAGLLAVRSRLLDVLTLGTISVALTVLALVVPPPP